MKFTVSHLGRIAAAELEIKPLTVFVGKANTNKTWTAYALYGLIRSLARGSFFSSFPSPSARCDKLDTHIEEIAVQASEKLFDIVTKEGNQSQSAFAIEVTRTEVFERAHPIGATISFELKRDEIGAMLAVEPDILGEATASLEFPTADFIAKGKFRAISITWNKQYGTIVGVFHSGVQYQRAVFAGIPFDPSKREQALGNLKLHIVNGVRWLAYSIFDEAMAFPAERKGLLPVIGTPIAQSLFASQNFTVNQPSQDYIRFLSFVQGIPFQRQGAPAKTLQLLENEIMGGKADFQAKGTQRIFNFEGTEGPPVQINASASFARSLAGLDLYLRLSQSDVIVIDEPEMNAHPEAQLKLAEFFAILANQGRHIVITTHSPYFVDHLNNLIAGAGLPAADRARIAGSLKLKDSSAFISANNAAAYLFNDDGRVVDLIEDGAVNVDGFAKETDFLGDIYGQIADAKRSGEGHGPE